jgi:hypothetical protein
MTEVKHPSAVASLHSPSSGRTSTERDSGGGPKGAPLKRYSARIFLACVTVLTKRARQRPLKVRNLCLHSRKPGRIGAAKINAEHARKRVHPA